MNSIQAILQEIEKVFANINQEQVHDVVERLAPEKRIFVVGEGRSGLMAKSFAMRLMHLGYQVYVVGETITPAIQKNDHLVAVSGSGTTSSIVNLVEKAKKSEVIVVGVTSDKDSRLAKMSDQIVHIPSATKFRKEGEIESKQPLSSLFDQSVHLFFDAVCMTIMQKQESGNQDAFGRHSNLE